MVNLAIAEAMAREQRAAQLKQAEQARLVKLVKPGRAATKPTLLSSEARPRLSLLAHLIIRFSRA